MPKILFLKGLPASGKSTYALELVSKEPDKWVRVNKDSLRGMLHDGKWSKGREKLVRQMQIAMADEALRSGLSVIIDDTNFAPKHEATYRQMAERWGAEFEIKFFDADVEDCIERDLKRKNPVGKDVILRMFHDHICTKDLYQYTDLPIAVICDIDGTLAHMTNRHPFEWDKVGNDICNTFLCYLLTVLKREKFKILFVSGRDEGCRKQTEKWLKDHLMEGYDELWMRPKDNNEKDSIIKERIYRERIEGKFHVRAVFDDRPQVVRFWRRMGLFVFDCGHGYEF